MRMYYGYFPFESEKEICQYPLNLPFSFLSNHKKMCNKLLKKLLEKKPEKRIGCVCPKTGNKNGSYMQQIKDQEYFKDVNFEKISERHFRSPFCIPNTNHPETYIDESEVPRFRTPVITPKGSDTESVTDNEGVVHHIHHHREVDYDNKHLAKTVYDKTFKEYHEINHDYDSGTASTFWSN